MTGGERKVGTAAERTASKGLPAPCGYEACDQHTRDAPLLRRARLGPNRHEGSYYEVDGTAKYANLTLTNQSGGTEQNQVRLPFELKFYAKSGQSVYLSAQKAKATKKVLHTLGDQQEVVYDGIAGTVTC